LSVNISLSQTDQTNFSWASEFNLDGKITVNKQVELGDGGSSRVYVGKLNDTQIAVKQLKCYSVCLAPCLVKCYERLFTLHHDNVVRVLGVCPQAGQVALEYCEKQVDGGGTLHSLSELLMHLGSDFSFELKLNALADITEGLMYLHKHGIIHGDIKPANVLVSGKEANEYIFKITDYSCNSLNRMSSRSSSLKQLMTPGYTAPELFTDTGICVEPTMTSDIYSFGMLSYEIVFQREPWANVSMLINAVRSGFRPSIPDTSPLFITEMIELCWHHDCKLRPCASEVLEMLDTAINTFENALVDSPSLEVFDSTNAGNDCTISYSGNGISKSLTSSGTAGVDSQVINVLPITNQPISPATNFLDSSSLSEATKVLYSSSVSEASDDVAENQSNCNTCASNEGCDLALSQRGTSEDVLNVSVPLGSSSSSSSQQLLNTQSSSAVLEISDDSMESNQGIINLPTCYSVDLEAAKSTLKIREFKRFQVDCVNAISLRKDCIVVQPTGSGKSLCFVLPAILYPGKVSLVVEPVVAVITNQVDALLKKGITALALGNAAGKQKAANYRRIFQQPLNKSEPVVAFCTPEYLFGTPSSGGFLGTVGQFNTFLSKKEYFSVVTIDEAHKIFDRLPSYRPAFDKLRQLQKLLCPIIAMSATLTADQIALLKKDYMCGEDVVVLTKGVHRENVKLQVQRYKRRKQVYSTDEVIDSDDEEPVSLNATSSLWEAVLHKIKPMMESQSTVVYLDFVKDVEEVTDILRQSNFKAGKYTGKMTVEDRKQADRKLLQGELSVLVATESFELGVDNPNINQVIRIGCPRNLGVLLQEVGRAGRKPGSIANGLLLFDEYVDDKRLGLWLKTTLDERVENAALQSVKADMLSNYVKA